MADIALDANVIVADLDDGDVHHKRARELLDRLEREGHTLVLLDVCVGEAVSVVCRRARERKASPPDLDKVLATVRNWHTEGAITWVAVETERLFDEVIATVEATNGRLNFNDAVLVALHRERVIDALASFDAGFDQVAGFKRLL